MNLKKKMKTLLDRFQKLELDAQGVLGEVTGAITATSVPDLVDSGWAARECAKIGETLRKAFTARQEIIGRSLAAMAGAESLRGVNVDLDGEFATGKVDITVKPKMPVNGSPEMVALLRWLGVSDDLIARDVIRPSFRAIQTELTNRLATGEKPPPGIVMTYNDMLVVFRKKTKASSTVVKENEDVSEEEF